jgi:hypothetical protein
MVQRDQTLPVDDPARPASCKESRQLLIKSGKTTGKRRQLVEQPNNGALWLLCTIN